MSTYVIGDVQGCYDPLCRLLERIVFDPARDRLWFVGDLVNRGPQSREVVRFVMGLGDKAITVLGNHDLALLVVAQDTKKAHATDTFHDVLSAPDRDELLHWLRHQKMIHVDGPHVMVHAGLPPQWSVRQAEGLGREVEAALRGDGYREFLNNMYGDEPVRWDDGLVGLDRLRVITNAMTRMRLTRADGTMEFRHKIGLERVPPGYMAWFDVPGRASADATVIFGHWASLGLRVRTDIVALDTGCVWGRALSALRLEDRQIVQCDCPEMAGTDGGQ